MIIKDKFVLLTFYRRSVKIGSNSIFSSGVYVHKSIARDIREWVVQYHHLGYDIKSFYKLYDYAINNGMEYQRKKVLDFWGKHGLAAAMDAFNVSRSAL